MVATVEHPLRLILIGLVMLLGSWAVLFLNVLTVLPPSLGLSIGAYSASTAGLFVGVLGAAGYVRNRHE